MLKIYNMYFSIINQVVQFVCLWMQDLFNYTINVSYVVDALTKYFFFSLVVLNFRMHNLLFLFKYCDLTHEECSKIW